MACKQKSPSGTLGKRLTRSIDLKVRLDLAFAWLDHLQTPQVQTFNSPPQYRVGLTCYSALHP
jgi:hypothetical protein